MSAAFFKVTVRAFGSLFFVGAVSDKIEFGGREFYRRVSFIDCGRQAAIFPEHKAAEIRRILQRELFNPAIEPATFGEWIDAPEAPAESPRPLDRGVVNREFIVTTAPAAAGKLGLPLLAGVQ